MRPYPITPILQVQASLPRIGLTATTTIVVKYIKLCCVWKIDAGIIFKVMKIL
jgi:hypothetical protein